MTRTWCNQSQAIRLTEITELLDNMWFLLKYLDNLEIIMRPGRSSTSIKIEGGGALAIAERVDCHSRLPAKQIGGDWATRAALRLTYNTFTPPDVFPTADETRPLPIYPTSCIVARSVVQDKEDWTDSNTWSEGGVRPPPKGGCSNHCPNGAPVRRKP